MSPISYAETSDGVTSWSKGFHDGWFTVEM